jgi:hypothetical protein
MGGWRKLHNEELHNLHFLPGISRTIKSRRMRLAGHVAQMGRSGKYVCYWWESQNGMRPLARLRHWLVDNIKIMERQNGVIWTGLVWVQIATSGGLLSML